MRRCRRSWTAVADTPERVRCSTQDQVVAGDQLPVALWVGFVILRTVGDGKDMYAAADQVANGLPADRIPVDDLVLLDRE